MSRLLVIVDMQNGFNCDEAKQLVDKFNQNSIKFDYICFTTLKIKKNSFFDSGLKSINFQDEKDYALLEKLTVPNDSYHITHHNYTIYNDEFKTLLGAVSPDEVYLSGLFSDVGLLKTSMDMFDDNIIPYIIKDLSTSPHGDEAHELAFETMKDLIGENRIVFIDNLL